MEGRNVVLTFLCLVQVILQVASREIYVTHSGRNFNSCGRYNQPCQTVRFAVGHSYHKDTVLVNYTKGWPYHECEEKNAILIQHSLTIQGINGSAEIQCRENRTLFRIIQRYSTIHSFENINLTFGNLTLSNSNSGVVVDRSPRADIKLIFNECTFRNNTIGILMKRSAQCSLVLKNTSFYSHHSAGIESHPCEKESIFSITNSLFYSSSILQQEETDACTTYELLINNCYFFGGNVKRQRYQNGIFVHSFAQTTKIIINKTIFKNHVGLNYNEYLLWIKADKQKTTSITLDQLTFEDNYWRKTLIYLYTACAREFRVVFENSLFQNNTGTIELAISPFNSNKYVLNRYSCNKTIVLKNNTFLRNHHFPCEGLSGIYATLFLNLGSFQVVSCKFIDNIIGQSTSTGVISISEMVNVTLKDSYFELGEFVGTAIQVFAYPNSLLKILGNNTINITKLNGGKTIFIHLPYNNLPSFRSNHYGSGVLMAGILNFICPQGFNPIQQMNKRSGQKQNETLAFTYLNVLCLACPRKTYSLHRGVLTYIPNNTTPKQENCECHECPRGGNCALGYLKAKPNFWGYRIENKVRFIDCPHDYCCESNQCVTYNSCKGKRTGRLCGRCPSDTSESLFSTACRHNNTCNASIFFPAAALLIIAFILFFLYNEDIVRFLQKGFYVKLPSLMDRDDDKGESGGIKILFYYYQTINLLISSVGSDEKNTISQRVRNLISNIFNLVVADISSFDCPFPNITPVSKTLMSHSLGFVLLFTLGVGCLLWKFYSKVRRRKRINVGASSLNPLVENECNVGNSSFNNRIFDSFEANEMNNVGDSCRISLTERALGAFTHICLLMYSTTARLCLTLLHCVPYKNIKVLFIDGTMQCYQSFQFVLLGYVIISVLPFCMVPFLGSYVLNLGLISVTQFCLACLLPFPFCCYWLFLLRSRVDVNRDHMPDHNAIHTNRLAILHVLTGPFRTHEPASCFPRSRLAWEGVLILRRLVLILIFAFTYDRRWRSLCALTACVLILVIHLRVQPFRKRWENCLETASLTTLVIFCGFTLIKALYRGEDYSSLYTKSTFMRSLSTIEDILIISPLAAIVLMAFILLLTRLINFLGRCFV